MAIARLSAKVGKAGKAGPHADYIAREGAYARRLEKGEALEANESGNMPGWAEAHPGEFWRSADAHERANGTTYREFELALPRELTPEDRAALVRDFVKQEIGDRHAYTWAIHRPKAADGLDQPHAHLMFSERRLDGIERDPEQYFKRYNAKAPEKGGARKGFGERPGQTLTAAERKAELRDLRGRWESLTNAHLERAGVDARIDMRSYRAQGIERHPEKKQLPSAWRDPGQRGAVLEFRQVNRDREEAAADLRRLIPDPASDLAKRARADALRAERMATYDRPAAVPEQQPKAPAIERPAPAVEARGQLVETAAQRSERQALEMIAAGPAGTAEKLYDKALSQFAALRLEKGQATLEALEQERRALNQARQAHEATKPWTPIGRGKWEAAGVALEQSGRDLSRRETAAAKSVEPETIQAAAKAAAAKAIPRVVDLATRERQAREDREAAEQAVKAAAAKDAIQNALLARDFNSIAGSRERKIAGYRDSSDDWKDTPAELRKQIDDYIALPKERRETVLKTILADPKARDEIRDLLKERKQTLSKQRSR